MNFDFVFYWKLFIRRFPVMAVFVLLGASLGVITALKLPETWSTSARLLVEAPQIPDDMVRSTVQTDVVEQLDIIQQRLLTRANLIDIANKYSVFTNLREMEPDTVVAQMRAATNLRRTAGRDQATLLTISFDARTGQIAANVVNELVTIVLQENSDFRLSRAENTLQFFEQEVRRMEEDLSAQSGLISTFKSDNVDSLPENQAYRLGRQALLQERLERFEREVDVLEVQRKDLVRIYEATGQVRQGAEPIPLSLDEQRLAAAAAELNQALSIYSETHPIVVRLRALVTRLEQTVALEKASNLAPEEDGIQLEEAGLQAALAEVDNRLQFLKRDLETTMLELAELEEAISRSSSNGITLNSLEREYAIIESRYNVAVNNLNSARMSERIETSAQGQRITVIENANVPRVPTGPNRPKIAIAGAAAGIALASAYFVLLELLNRTIRRPAEMMSRFNITPITSIPYMESRQRRFMRRSGLIGASLFALVSVPLALWYIDSNYLPLEILVQKGLSRLGLG